MEQNEDLIRLAGVVEELLASFNQLKQEKMELIQVLGEKDNHIEELQASVARLKDEKADVSQRVSGILAALENWEKGQDAEGKKSLNENASESLSAASPQLFSMES
jgi:predicted nuclease with TOPRIM domain